MFKAAWESLKTLILIFQKFIVYYFIDISFLVFTMMRVSLVRTRSTLGPRTAQLHELGSGDHCQVPVISRNINISFVEGRIWNRYGILTETWGGVPMRLSAYEYRASDPIPSQARTTFCCSRLHQDTDVWKLRDGLKHESERQWNSWQFHSSVATSRKHQKSSSSRTSCAWVAFFSIANFLSRLWFKIFVHH